MIGLGIGILFIIAAVYFFKTKAAGELKKNLAVDKLNAAKAQQEAVEILKEAQLIEEEGNK